MTPDELMGKKMVALMEFPNCARLQAATVAMAALGVYSPPFGKWIDIDTLGRVTDFLISSGVFPLTTEKECADSFRAAVDAYEAEHQGEDGR